MSKINTDHHNRMLDALKTIATGYQTPQQIEKVCKDQWGLSYVEALEMAYENIQQLAKEASKGVRRYQNPFTVITSTTPARPGA